MDLKRTSDKQIAIGLGTAITVLACLFPPLKFLGIRTWGFIFGNAGFGMVNIQFLDAGMLILEIAVIWLIIGGIYYLDQLRVFTTARSGGSQASYKFCVECGSRIEPGDNFCGECGAKCV